MKKGSPYLETENTVKFNEVSNGENQNLFINNYCHCGEVWLSPSPSPQVLMEGTEKSQTKCYLADLMRLQFADNQGLSLVKN